VALYQSWPGKVPPGRVSDAIFATLDFLPTFASLAGAEVPGDRRIDGVDQTGLLFGKSESGARDSFFYVNGYRKGKWKYLAADHCIYGYSRDTARAIEEELYDLSVDTGESNNLAGEDPDVVAELRALMEKDPLQPIKNASPEVQEIVKKVLKIEKDWLYSDRPRIAEDILNLIKEVVQ